MARDQTQSGIAPVGKTHVALLRGINVGGKNLLPMKLLVRLFEACGCRAVETYIQSGNVLFAASPEVARQLSKAVNQAIFKESRLAVPVIIRTVGELAAVVRAQPFDKAGADPKALHVAFLADEPSAAQLAALDSRRSPPDSFLVRGREIYLCLPNGMARTRLTNAYFDSKLATVATIRGLRTVETLLELCTSPDRPAQPVPTVTSAKRSFELPLPAMTRTNLPYLICAFALACSGPRLHTSTDGPSPASDSSDTSANLAPEVPSPASLDLGPERAPPDTTVDTTVIAAPDAVDAIGAIGAKDAGTAADTQHDAGPIAFVDAMGIDATRDAASEPGVDGEQGPPICAQSTTTAAITLEIPSGKVTVGTAYGSSPNDVWVSTLPDHKVARWNGTAWSWVAELAGTPIYAIAGSGSSDVWLGGTGGALFHWDGNTLSPANSNSTLDIQQITVLGSGQAFALAFLPVHSGTFDLLRLASLAWSVVGQSAAPKELYYLPHALYAPTADEAWVVLYDQVFHYQHNLLGSVPVQNPTGVWGTAPDNVWFGECKWDGEKIVQPLAGVWGPMWGTGPSDMWIDSIHWDGQTATDYATNGLNYGPTALFGLSATDVWAIAQAGRIVHFDASKTWNEVVAGADAASSAPGGLANGIWQVGAKALWITGLYNQIYLYDGGALVPIPNTGVPPSDGLLGVWGSTTNDLWAVGKNGAILHGDGTGWTRVASPATNTLRAVSGSAADDVWAVGDAGTILHWNGVGWSAAVSNTSADLLAVWATVGYVVAVGANGTILANAGSVGSSGFVAQPSGATATLSGVWGRSPTDVYVADGKNLFIYDGSDWTQKTIASGTCVSGLWGTTGGVFADGYYDDGTQVRRVVPAYPPANHNGAVVCLQLDGVWAGAATDFWSLGGEIHLLPNDATKHIYRFNGECIETVGSDLYRSFYIQAGAGPAFPTMRAIFGIGEHDLWAVGDLGIIAHIRR